MCKSAVCTLFEGEYHYGVGALANSLYEGDYKGTLWVGYRGKLPPWAQNGVKREKCYHLPVSDQFDISFVKLKTDRHFANYKPHFMSQVLQEFDASCNSVFYFDPDIVSKCRWDFYQEWVSHGVALCLDSDYPYMPISHPLRLQWIDYAESNGYKIKKQPSAHYYNSGFIGVERHNKQIITIWRDLVDLLFQNQEELLLSDIKSGDRTRPFNVPDQDLLNLAAMLTDSDLSVIGPEAMDFSKGSGYIMSHATLSPKPWEKKYTRHSVLDGKAPRLADKNFWKYTQSPIQLFSKRALLLKKIDLKVGAALGRLTRS